MEVLTIVGLILQFPFKLIGRALGVTGRPNIILGPISADVTDPRPPFRSWYHVRCENVQRVGLRAKLRPTADARECRVTTTFTHKVSGDVMKRDGVFVVGAVPPEAVTTLYVGKPVWIPVYWVAETGGTVHPLGGQTCPAGTYATGQEFIWWPGLSARHQLPPGSYGVSVDVIWGRMTITHAFDLEVPIAEGAGGEPIEVTGLPPDSNYVQLLVRNSAASQDFIADAIDFQNIEGPPQTQYSLKWRGRAAEPSIAIFRGADAVLDIAEILPPVRDPAGNTTRGSFRLFSTSSQEGWIVRAGTLNYITTVGEALRAPDPAAETIALKVRITGSENLSKTCRVTLGFERPFEINTFEPRSLVRIEVDDWPED